MSKIIVIGSSNTDMVIKAPHLPKPGETVLGGTFFMNPGGKGANQAFAAAKLGGDVVFLSKLGKDIFAEESLVNFKKAGINTDLILFDKRAPSGIALINVDNKGQNSITVAPGANAALGKEDIDNNLKAILEADYILVQLEIPIETVEYIIEISKKHRKKLVLNPAPANSLKKETFNRLFAITPNETETEILTGVQINHQERLEHAGRIFLEWGVLHVIITLGAKGALYMSKEKTKYIEGYKVNALDTTAAGDIFNGALVSGMAGGMKMEEAIVYANKAAAISVTRMGAQASAPDSNEMNNFNKK